MKIVVAMAGLGARFRDAGWKAPKPMIDVLGEPMYSWALKGLPLALADLVVLIISDELNQSADFHRDLQERYGHLPLVVRSTPPTEGQACTVLVARDLIDDDDALLIFNADTYQRSTRLRDLICDPQIDGSLSVFKAPGDKWSFVRTDSSGRVVETSEKRRISDWASTGLYHFAHGKDFVSAADEMIAANDRVNGEFYVAPVYNRLLKRGANIRLNQVDEVHVLGTPEDLHQFMAEAVTWKGAQGG